MATKLTQLEKIQLGSIFCDKMDDITNVYNRLTLLKRFYLANLRYMELRHNFTSFVIYTEEINEIFKDNWGDFKIKESIIKFEKHCEELGN